MIYTQALTYTDKISKDLNFNKLNFAILDFLGILFWYISLGREGGLNCEVHFSQDAASAALHCSARPQTPPNPDDAIGAGYAWAKFKLRLAAKFWLKFCVQFAVTPCATPLLGAFYRRI